MKIRKTLVATLLLVAAAAAATTLGDTESGGVWLRSPAHTPEEAGRATHQHQLTCGSKDVENVVLFDEDWVAAEGVACSTESVFDAELLADAVATENCVHEMESFLDPDGDDHDFICADSGGCGTEQCVPTLTNRPHRRTDVRTTRACVTIPTGNGSLPAFWPADVPASKGTTCCRTRARCTGVFRTAFECPCE